MTSHAIDRDIDYLLPPLLQERLPEAHLAPHLVDVVKGLDLSALERSYTERGSKAYHPATQLSSLIYGYVTGTFSRCKIERATFDSLASFRKRFGKDFPSAFVQVLQIARENQLSRFGTVSLDGTNIHANASLHSTLSYGHAEKVEARLKAEVQELLALLAGAADESSAPRGASLPDAIKRREDRLAAFAVAKAKIEARPKERNVPERAQYEVKMGGRAEKAATTGKKPDGKLPMLPASGPRADDQINLTHEGSRNMAVVGGAFEQCYNAQVASGRYRIDADPRRGRHAGDERQGEQVEPLVEKRQENPEGLNQPEAVFAETGYPSQKNVTTCVETQVMSPIAVKLDAHHSQWRERFTEPPPLAENASAINAIKPALKTKAGRAAYVLCNPMVVPVFGIIKSLLSFRQFLRRGMENAQNEWALVCLAWNLQRIAALRLQKETTAKKSQLFMTKRPDFTPKHANLPRIPELAYPPNQNPAGCQEGSCR